MRKRDIEKVDALVEKVKAIPGRERQVADLEATGRALRESLLIPPRSAEKRRHDMKPIMVVKKKKPHATAVCVRCKTMAEDREHGRRLNKGPCWEGVPRDAPRGEQKEVHCRAQGSGGAG